MFNRHWRSPRSCWRGSSYEPTVRAERPSFDVKGSVLLGLTLGAFLYGLNYLSEGWTPSVYVPLALSPVFAALFIRVERRHPDPLLHLEYFRRRNVAVPMVLILLAHIPYMGTFFLAPFMLHDVLDYNNARTALALAPRPLSNSLASLAAGYLAIKLGERSTTVGGMAALAGGLFVLTAVGPNSSFQQIVLALVLTGMGLGLSFPGLVSSIANAVEEKDFGATSAAQEMLMMVGMTLGMQGMQTLQAIRARSVGAVQGYQDAFGVGAVIATVATLLAFSVRSMHRAQPVPPSESPEAGYLPERVR